MELISASDGDASSPFSLMALRDVMTERYGPGIAAAVVAQLALERGNKVDALPSEVVRRALAMADEAELAIAGTAWFEHLSISAVGDTPGFKTAARLVGMAAESFRLAERVRADAAFASAWRERRRIDPAIGGKAAAIALMQETLRAIRFP